MSYTVVGLFPNNEMADTASNKLDNSGFAKSDYSVSKYQHSGEYNADADTNYEYEEDEKTSGFWSWLFGEDDSDRKRYSYAGTKSNVVTVYTDDLDRAEKAREIMNDNGAINVNDFSKGYVENNNASDEEFIAPSSNELNRDERARIINKAKNDLYLNPSDRNYTWRQRGMKDEMDSQGYGDRF